MYKIAIIGKQCSGKTTIAEMIRAEFEGCAHIVKFAEPHYEMLEALHQPKHRLFMQQVSDLCKTHFGVDIFVKIFESHVNGIIESCDEVSEVIICDDVRYQREIDKVKEMGFLTIYVSCSDETRKARAAAQGLVFNEKHNSEAEIESLEEQADISIVNEGSESVAEAVKFICEQVKKCSMGLSVENETGIAA